MSGWDSIAVVIPCCNEARFIGSVVAAARRHVPLVIVADDGSADDTSAIAQVAGAEVVHLETNLGKGLAAAQGLERARAMDCEWAVLMDGDGQHDANDIPALLHAARSQRSHLVVGNRMHQRHAIPMIRRWVNRIMSGDLSRWTGHALPDTQCGFRLIHLPTWAACDLRAPRFEFESELLITFLARGARVSFAPIAVRYADERSKIRPLRDTWRWLQWRQQARARWRRRTALPITAPLPQVAR
jgi:glycosyltransferase involved in cell wall biosynthesis